MKFDCYIPCKPLQPFVRSMVISESDDTSAYKVLPDTGLVIGFQYKGTLSRIAEGKEIALSGAGITGLHDRFREFKNSAPTGTVLVYFRETGAAAFFRQPVHELFRESLSLDNFMQASELQNVEELLFEAADDEGRIQVVENYLLSRLRIPEPDLLVAAALMRIHQSRGAIKIKELADELHISQSPLEKRFRKIAGASPKKFASIVRFRNILKDHHSYSSLTDMGYGAGFYDQAHFIREFKNFTGATPEQFFIRK